MAARKPRARRVYDPHYWQSVRVRMLCSLGEHWVFAGTWVRLRRNDPLRMASCEACLRKQYGVERPARPFVFRGDAPVDARRRRAGEDS